MEGTVGLIQYLLDTGVPLDTINAVANTITAGAALWAARTLRRSITDIRLLRLQSPFSASRALSDEEHERLWRDIKDKHDAEADDLS